MSERSGEDDGPQRLIEWIRHLEQEVAAWEGENRVLDAAIASLDRRGESAPATQRELEDTLLARHEEVKRVRAEHDELRDALELKKIEARGLAHDLAQFREARRRAAVETATLHVALEESLVAVDVSQVGHGLRDQLRGVRALVDASAPRAGDATAEGAVDVRARAVEPGHFRTAGDNDLVHRAHFASYGLSALRDRAAHVRAELRRLEHSVERARARVWAEDRAALRTARELSAAALARMAAEAARPAPLLEHCLPLLLAAAASVEELRVAAQLAVGKYAALRDARKAQRLRRLQARAQQCRELLAAVRAQPLAAGGGAERSLDVRAQTLVVDAELRAEVSRLRDLSAGVQEEEQQLQRLRRYVAVCDAHTSALGMSALAAERASQLEREELAAAAFLVSAQRRLKAIERVGSSATEDDLGSASAAVCERRAQLDEAAAAVARLGADIGAVLKLATISHFRVSTGAPADPDPPAEEGRRRAGADDA